MTRAIQRRWYRGQEEKEEHKSARLRSLKSATSSKSRQGCWVLDCLVQQGGVKGVRLRIYEPPVPLWEEDVNHPAAKEGQLGSLANLWAQLRRQGNAVYS